MDWRQGVRARQLASRLKEAFIVRRQKVAIAFDAHRFLKFGWMIAIALSVLQSRAIHAQQGSVVTKVVAQLGHGNEISAVAFSDDCALAVSGDNQGVVLVWDVKTGRMLKAFRTNSDPVRSIRFSEDGKKVLASHWQSLRIWDLERDIVEREINAPEHGAFERGIFFSSGQKMIYANDQSPIVFDLRSSVALDFSSKHSDAIDALALSNDGSRAFSASATSLRFWKTSDGTLIRKIEMKLDRTRAVALSSNGAVAISATGSSLSTWDTVGGGLKKLGSHKGSIWAVSISVDGKFAVSGGADNTVKLWNVVSGTLINTLEGSSAAVQAVAVSADNRLVIAGGDDRSVRIWRADTGALVHTFTGSMPDMPALSASRDGSILLHSSTPNRVAALDTRTGRLINSFALATPAAAVALSPDGKRTAIGTAKGEISLWEVHSGQKLFANPAHRSSIRVVGFGNSGSIFYAGGADKEISIWDVNSRALVRRLKGLPEEPEAISFIERGSAIVAIDRGCTIKKWTFSTGALRSRSGKASPGGTCLNAAFSPNGKIALAGSDNNAVAWVYDVDRNERSNSNQELRVLEGHRIDISSVSFSPSGELAFSGTPDGELKIWNVSTWNSVGAFPSIPGGIIASAFISEDQFAVINSGGELSLLSKQAAQVIIRHKVYADGSWITITPEGFFDSSSQKAAQNLSVVRGLELYSIDQFYQALYRPDLVREKLAGDPKGLVREAAVKLDLNKVLASGGAPRVSIVTPSGRIVNDEATVEASIVEQNGGGIGKIEWRVNGVTLGVEARGMERLPEGTASPPAVSRPAMAVRRTLSLEPGENRIEVVAYNGRNLIASNPAQVVLKWDGENSATLPRLHVMVVGVNDYYDSRLKLSYAVPDAKALGDAMKKAGSSIYQSVEVTSVLDNGVTVDNLDKVFSEVSKKVQPRDVFVFFLAGHGKTVDGRYHFLPQNFRYENEESVVKRGIDQDRFQAWFAKIPARKSILLYDTCESGSLTGDRVQQRGLERVTALEKMTRAMGRTVLSASSDDAPALEGYRGHGVFTYALLDGLQGADTNGNGLIEVTELAAFIDQQVPDLSFKAFKMRQIPQMKIVGNSFPVVSKTTVLQASSAQIDGQTTAVIPTKPTHVVVSQSPIDVFLAAAGGGAVVLQLPPGTLVTLVATSNGWQLVAKDGQKLGYVDEKALMRVQ